MTWEEFEKGMQELREQLAANQRQSDVRMERIEEQVLVNHRLLERHERESNERMERIEAVALRHQELLLRHEERLGDAEERQRSLGAAMQALIETVDRFIRGREGNGQKGQQ